MQDISPESPEARRKRLAKTRARLGSMRSKMKPGQYPFEVVKRVVVGVYNDGFIHAGNLAYLALMSLFPFVIVAAAVARLFGQTEEGLAAVNGILQTMPPDVADVLRKPIGDVINARSGSLLWLGALVGLWTTGSFIETIRDIIRRAYGVTYSRPFWEYRLGSVGHDHRRGDHRHGRLQPLGPAVRSAAVHRRSDPARRGAGRPDHPVPGGAGADAVRCALPDLLFAHSEALSRSKAARNGRALCSSRSGGWRPRPCCPLVLSSLGGYDLTYGSLAGVIIGLTFFFIVGLGVVIGAELNAALAEAPEEALKEGEEPFYKRESI